MIRPSMLAVLALFFQAPIDRKAADDFYQKQDWAHAAPAFDAIVKANPADADAWFKLGMSRHSLKSYRDAINAFTKVTELRAAPVATFDLACAHARLGETDLAFDALERALIVGFGDLDQLKTDDDLASLRSDPRFASIVTQMSSANTPTAGVPEARQFDFWVGEWEVHGAANGSLAGHSKIEKILNDNVILENWTGQGGGAGKSFNTYDPRTKRWHQHWVDMQGNALDFVDGEYKDKSLSFRCKTTTPSGRELERRLTFYDQGPDRVRQFSQGSLDGGKTWFVEYDFIYDRVK